MCRFPIRCIAPGEEKVFDPSIPPDVSFAVNNEELGSDSVEPLILRKKSSRVKNLKAWSFGSEDIPSSFKSAGGRPRLQICLETSEIPGWIAEDICIESDQFIHLHQDLNRRAPMQHKLILMAFVSETPNVLDETMQSIRKPGKNRSTPPSDAEVRNPDLHSLRTPKEEPTAQPFLMLMTCEMGIFQSDWCLSEDKAIETLDSTPEEAVELCVQRVTDTMTWALDGSSRHSESLQEYSERLKDLLKREFTRP